MTKEIKGHGPEIGLPTPVIPACQGWARFDTVAQAVYVAEDMKESEGGAWVVEKCGDHFHVKEVL